jgi:hypothetical protein
LVAVASGNQLPEYGHDGHDDGHRRGKSLASTKHVTSLGWPYYFPRYTNAESDTNLAPFSIPIFHGITRFEKWPSDNPAALLKETRQAF